MSGVKLDSVEAGLPGPADGGGELGGDVVDLTRREHPRLPAVAPSAGVGGRDRIDESVGTAMGELGHHLAARAMPMDRVGDGPRRIEVAGVVQVSLACMDVAP